MPDEPGAPLAFSFDADHPLAPGELLELLGGKGCGLAVLTAMGLPVPHGFTLTTAACRRFIERGWTDELDEVLRAGLADLEHATGRRLGAADPPLLVSVRSGAEVSMPGMMDTVLDVGITDDVVRGLAEETGDAAFAEDTHRRALIGHAALVAHAPVDVLRAAGAATEVATLREILAAAGVVVPADPVAQVAAAVQAVFRSWTSARARRYREVEGIDHSLGTAATVQAMVFGNLGADSGTGVAFSRDPSTGAPGLMGDFLARAQGQDVVAGDHRTVPLAEMSGRWPDAWAELVRIAAVLEHEFEDMVDLEFTVERGRLWLLQARTAKRSPAAALRVAVDLAEDPSFAVDRREAVRRCRHLLDRFERSSTASGETADAPAEDDDAPVLATGLAASPGRAVGQLCLDADRAVELAEGGTDVVLVRRETSPADVHGMAVAAALVTTLGGLVSHAAVVARSWGIPAVVGAEGLVIHHDGVEGNGIRAAAGEVLTVDGDAGRVLVGDHPRPVEDVPAAGVLRRWAAEERGSE